MLCIYFQCLTPTYINQILPPPPRRSTWLVSWTGVPLPLQKNRPCGPVRWWGTAKSPSLSGQPISQMVGEVLDQIRRMRGKYVKTTL